MKCLLLLTSVLISIAATVTSKQTEVPSSKLILEYNWPEPKKNLERYPDPKSCSQFYVNKPDRTQSLKKCPENELFDFRTLRCRPKVVAKCWNDLLNKKHLKKTKRRFSCPFPWGLYPDIEDCSTFYDCLSGQPYLRKCPSSTLFDKAERTCVDENEALCADHSDVVEDYYKCPNKWGYFTYSKDCSKFYECLRKVPSLRSCKINMLFDNLKRNCMPMSDVDCGERFNPYGIPARTATATLLVDVKDINDNAPQFKDFYRPVVMENVYPPIKVIELFAYDPDLSPNTKPWFKFQLDNEAPSVIKDSFRVVFNRDGDGGKGSATVYTKVKFDREQQQEYHVPIVIANSALPSMTSTNTLTVVIGDENDNTMYPGEKDIFVNSYKKKNKESIEHVSTGEKGITTENIPTGRILETIKFTSTGKAVTGLVSNGRDAVATKITLTGGVQGIAKLTSTSDDVTARHVSDEADGMTTKISPTGGVQGTAKLTPTSDDVTTRHVSDEADGMTTKFSPTGGVQKITKVTPTSEDVTTRHASNGGDGMTTKIILAGRVQKMTKLTPTSEDVTARRVSNGEDGMTVKSTPTGGIQKTSKLTSTREEITTERVSPGGMTARHIPTRGTQETNKLIPTGEEVTGRISVEGERDKFKHISTERVIEKSGEPLTPGIISAVKEQKSVDERN